MENAGKRRMSLRGLMLVGVQEGRFREND